MAATLGQQNRVGYLFNAVFSSCVLMQKLSQVGPRSNQAQHDRQEDQAVAETHDCGREKLLEEHL